MKTSAIAFLAFSTLASAQSSPFNYTMENTLPVILSNLDTKMLASNPAFIGEASFNLLNCPKGTVLSEIKMMPGSSGDPMFTCVWKWEESSTRDWMSRDRKTPSSERLYIRTHEGKDVAICQINSVGEADQCQLSPGATLNDAMNAVFRALRDDEAAWQAQNSEMERRIEAVTKVVQAGHRTCCCLPPNTKSR